MAEPAYVLIGLYGGIMNEHEVFMDWRLAHKKVEDLKDSYNITTVEVNPETHHLYATNGDMAENEIFVLPSKLNK